MEAVGRDMDEVHVGADGRKGFVPAEGLAFRVDIDLLHVVHELDEVAGTGVQEIATQHGRNPLHVNHFNTDFPEAVLRAGEDFAGVEAVRGAEEIRSFGKLRMTGRADAQVVGEGDDATAAIAAHHAAGTVGVVELHDKIDRWPLGVGHDVMPGLYVMPGLTGHLLSQDHQSVGPEFPAKRFDPGDFPEGGDVAFAAVDDHEVVPRTGELIKLCFHGFGS